MSAAPPPVPTTTHGARSEEIRVFQHSALLYWWPVWLVGFIMFGVTMVDGGHAAIVPSGTEARRNWPVVIESGKPPELREGLILPPGQHLLPDQPEKPGGSLPQPEGAKVHVARSKNLGVIFSITLLLTILISTVSVRGVWSVVVIVTVVLLVVLFALFDWWGQIAEWFVLLRIHINAGGYGFIAVVLFIIWAVNPFLFDRRPYVIFTAGQVRVREAIGQGEKVFDTTNLVFHKLQNNFFQHWIWGLGSGDLEIITAKGERFEWHNVAFVGYKVRKIEDLIKMKEV